MNNLSLSSGMTAYQFETLNRVHKLIADNMLSDVDMTPRRTDQGPERQDNARRDAQQRDRAADPASTQRQASTQTQNMATRPDAAGRAANAETLRSDQSAAAGRAANAETLRSDQSAAAGRPAERSAGIAGMSTAPVGLPGTEQKQAMLSSTLATLTPPPSGGDKSGGIGMPFASMGTPSATKTAPGQTQATAQPGATTAPQATSAQAPTTPTPAQAPVSAAMQSLAGDAAGQATQGTATQPGTQAAGSAAQAQDASAANQQGLAALRSAMAAANAPTAAMNALAQVMSAQGEGGDATQLPGGGVARQGAPADGATARQPQAAPTVATSETAQRSQAMRPGDSAATGRASAAGDLAGRTEARGAAAVSQQGAASALTQGERAIAASQSVLARSAAASLDGQRGASAGSTVESDLAASARDGGATRAGQATGREGSAPGLAYGTTAAGTARVADDVAMVRASATSGASLGGAIGAEGMRDPMGRVPAEGLLNTLVAGDAPSRAFAASVALNAAMIPGWPAPPPLEGVAKKGKMTGPEKAQEPAPVDPEEMAAHIAKFAAAKAAMRAFLDEMKVDPKKKKGLLSFLSGFVSCFTEAMEAAQDASAFYGGAEDAGGRPSRGRLTL